MAKEYEALEDFETPSLGAVSKGKILTLDDATGKSWLFAGLVREVKPKKDAALNKEGANG